MVAAGDRTGWRSDLAARYASIHDATFGVGGTVDRWWLEQAVALAKSFGAPVAELGCGTASLAVHLARAGLHVRATDFSPHMVDLARARLAAETPEVAQRVCLGVGDMCEADPHLCGRIVMLPSFCHLLDDAHRERCLSALAAVGAAGAIVYIPVVVPFRGDAGTASWSTEINGRRVVYGTKSSTEWVRRTHTVKYWWEEGDSRRRWEMTYAFSFPGEDELEAIATHCGWRCIGMHEARSVRTEPRKLLSIWEKCYELRPR